MFRFYKLGGDAETTVNSSRFVGPDVWKCFSEGVQSEGGTVIVFYIGSFDYVFGVTSLAVTRRQR